MKRKKFDPQKLLKLNDPARLQDIPPHYIWGHLQLPQAPKIIVDIGAGTGLFTVAFSRLAPGAKIYACDIAPEMIYWLKEKVIPFHPQICPVLMEECRLPLANGCADLVYMINLHHELDRPVDLLADCRRILKRGGTLFIVDWKKERTAHGPPLPLRVPMKEVERQLKETGFIPFVRDEGMKSHYLVVAH